jgi:REP element-mobilizing transposase RayT
MSRRPRRDAPEKKMHVGNRGVGRRPIFEGAGDVEFFLECLADCASRGILEVHALTLLMTHFHMFVGSPEGRLSDAMQLVENRYARAFNRKRRRDGPLMRGRFWSRRADSTLYRRAIVRYIDFNPVAAGLVANTQDYPYGSRRIYDGFESPPWLARDWIEGFVRSQTGAAAYVPAGYETVFPCRGADSLREIIERRSAFTGEDSDPTDQLWLGATEGVREWFLRRAHNADGTAPGVPVAAPATALAVLAEAREADPAWTVPGRTRRRSGWPVLTVAILRDLCGCSYAGIARLLGIESRSQLRQAHDRHVRLLKDDATYPPIVHSVTRLALARTYGESAPGADLQRPILLRHRMD